MVFSFVAQEFEFALAKLFETANKNLNSENEEQKRWAHKVRSLKSLFNKENLSFLDENLKETKKWALFDLSQLSTQVTNTELEHLKWGAVTLYVYLKEWGFRRGISENEQEVPILRNFYDFIYTEKNRNYLKFKTHYDFVDEIPYLICGEIYSNSKLNDIRKFLEEKDFSDFETLIETSDKTLLQIQLWEESIEEKKNTVKNLEERLEKNKLTYDFVLLSKGFQQLYDQKKLELKERRKGYSQFGATLVSVPIAVIVAVVIIILTGYEAKLASLWFLALPITTLMLFLFYFTRVGLQHVRSIQSSNDAT
ncbi:hypothetical protein [Acinetobacter variabilis]|uniref:hypothetical protein n=1 Tax=Acinetobacter variabilis TaxID=70346 RepID=UPI003D7670EF